MDLLLSKLDRITLTMKSKKGGAIIMGKKEDDNYYKEINERVHKQEVMRVKIITKIASLLINIESSSDIFVEIDESICLHSIEIKHRGAEHAGEEMFSRIKKGLLKEGIDISLFKTSLLNNKENFVLSIKK